MNTTPAQLEALKAIALEPSAKLHGRTRAKLEERGHVDADGITQEGLEQLDALGIV